MTEAQTPRAEPSAEARRIANRYLEVPPEWRRKLAEEIDALAAQVVARNRAQPKALSEADVKRLAEIRQNRSPEERARHLATCGNWGTLSADDALIKAREMVKVADKTSREDVVGFLLRLLDTSDQRAAALAEGWDAAEWWMIRASTERKVSKIFLEIDLQHRGLKGEPL